jgi:hypothetical protein
MFHKVHVRFLAGGLFLLSTLFIAAAEAEAQGLIPPPATPLPEPSFAESACRGAFTNQICQTQSGSTPGSVSTSRTFPHQAGEEPIVEAASATTTAYPNPSAMISFTEPGGFAVTNASIEYFFEVIGPADQSIDLLFTATGKIGPPLVPLVIPCTDGSCLSASDGFFASGLLTTSAGGSTVLGELCAASGAASCATPTGEPEFTTATVLPVTSGVLYSLNISLQSETGLSSVAALSLLIDPVITFADQSDANTFQLEFSPGIGNSGETPLPAALPLFATGLGGLGLLGRRRQKRKG